MGFGRFFRRVIKAVAAVAVVAVGVTFAPALIAGAGAFAGAGGAGFGAAILKFGVKALASVATSALVSAVMGNKSAKARRGQSRPFSLSFSAQVGGDIPRSFMLGKGMTPGSLEDVMTFGTAEGTSNAYLSEVFALSDLPVSGLSRVWVSDEWVTLDYAQPHGEFGIPVTQYRVSGTDHMWVKFYDGSQTAADSYFSGKTSATGGGRGSGRIGRGVAYVIVTSLIDQELFAAGRPTFRFEVDGIPLYDPTKDSSVGGSGAQRWNNKATWGGAGDNNPMVQAYNVMRGLSFNGQWLYGGQTITEGRLPSLDWINAINACAAQNFRAGGLVTVDTEVGDLLEALMTSCSGRLADCGGIYKPAVNVTGHVMTLTDADLSLDDDIEFTPFPAIDDAINGVSSTYPEPEEGYQMTEAPVYTVAGYVTTDRGERTASVPMPMVPYAEQIQRLNKMAVEEAREFRGYAAALHPRFSVLEPNDVIRWTSASQQYTDKDFRIISVDDLPNGKVFVSMRELNPAVGQWDTQTDFLAPTIRAPSASRPIPQSVNGLSFTPHTIVDEAGAARRPAILAAWGVNGIHDVDGLEFQVRPVGQNAVVHYSVTSDFTEARYVIESGLVGGGSYVARARYLINDKRRPVLWSAWLPVVTPDVRFDLGDVSDFVQTEIAKGETAIGLANAAQSTADGTADDLQDVIDAAGAAFAGSGLDLRLNGLDGSIASANSNISTAQSAINTTTGKVQEILDKAGTSYDASQLKADLDQLDVDVAGATAARNQAQAYAELAADLADSASPSIPWRMGLPESQWTRASTAGGASIKKAAANSAHFTNTDADFGECFIFPDTANATIGQAYPAEWEANRVYEVLATFKVIDDGTGGAGVDVRLGVTLQNGTTVTLTNHQTAAINTQAADGNVVVTAWFTGRTDITAPGGGIYFVGSIDQTGAPNWAYPHLRQNQGSTTDGRIKVQSLVWRDITNTVLSEKFAASAASSQSLAAQTVQNIESATTGFMVQTEDAGAFHDIRSSVSVQSLAGNQWGNQSAVQVTSVEITGQDPSGVTSGACVEIPQHKVANLWHRRARVDVVAREGATTPASRFSVAYSTSDNGNSGWTAFDIPQDRTWRLYSFYYDVPAPAGGGPDYIGVLGGLDAIGETVEVAMIQVHAAADAGDIPELGAVIQDLDTLEANYVSTVVSSTLLGTAISNKIDEYDTSHPGGLKASLTTVEGAVSDNEQAIAGLSTDIQVRAGDSNLAQTGRASSDGQGGWTVGGWTDGGVFPSAVVAAPTGWPNDRAVNISNLAIDGPPRVGDLAGRTFYFRAMVKTGVSGVNWQFALRGKPADGSGSDTTLRDMGQTFTTPDTGWHEYEDRLVVGPSNHSQSWAPSFRIENAGGNDFAFFNLVVYEVTEAGVVQGNLDARYAEIVNVDVNALTGTALFTKFETVDADLNDLGIDITRIENLSGAISGTTLYQTLDAAKIKSNQAEADISKMLSLDVSLAGNVLYDRVDTAFTQAGDASAVITEILNMDVKHDASVLFTSISDLETDVGGLTTGFDNILNMDANALAGTALLTKVQTAEATSLGLEQGQGAFHLRTESEPQSVFNDGPDVITRSLTGAQFSGGRCIFIESSVTGATDTSGFTSGTSILVPEAVARNFWGRKCRVDIIARPNGTSPATKFGAAYSTADTGNSGLIEFDLVGSEWKRYSFAYTVPDPAVGGDDFIGIWGDTQTIGGIVDVAVVQVYPSPDGAIDLPELGQAVEDITSLSATQTDILNLDVNNLAGTAILEWIGTSQSKAGAAETSLTHILNLSGSKYDGTALATEIEKIESRTKLQDGTLLTAAFTQQAQTLTDLTGTAAATASFKVQAGDQVSLLDLVAGVNGDQSVSLAKISADQILLEGSVGVEQLAVGLGRNEITNAFPALQGTVGWTFAGSSGPLTARGPLSTWSHPTEGVFQLSQPDANQSVYYFADYRGTTDATGTLANGIPITAGQWVEASAYVSAHRCEAEIFLYFVDINGTVITGSFTGSNKASTGGSQTDPSTWTRCTVSAQAPNGATHVRMRVVKGATNNGGDSYAMIWRPMVAYTEEGKLPTPFSSPATTHIGPAGIATNAITSDKIVAGAVTADKMVAADVRAQVAAVGTLSALGLTADRASIADAAINSAKIENLSINRDKMQAGALLTATPVGRPSVEVFNHYRNPTTQLSWAYTIPVENYRRIVRISVSRLTTSAIGFGSAASSGSYQLALLVSKNGASPHVAEDFTPVLGCDNDTYTNHNVSGLSAVVHLQPGDYCNIRLALIGNPFNTRIINVGPHLTVFEVGYY